MAPETGGVINVDLMQRARELTGRDVEITFADGGTERGKLIGTWTADRMFTLDYGTGSADYELDGTDNTHAGAADVPAITAIEPVD